MAVTITAVAQTDIGCVRKKNQDTFGVDDSCQLYIVCDGMGGAAGGEVASRLAADAFARSFRAAGTKASGLQRSAHALYQAAMAANAAVLARASAQPDLRGMGSTLVAAHIEGGRLHLVNVGDSRAYLVRREECTQLTVDHSYLEEQVRRGFMTREAASASPMQSVITRAVGIQEGFEPDLSHVMVEDGDLVLLTSDGLTRHVNNAAIAAVVSGKEMGRRKSLESRCAELIERAKKNGGSDNITCILLHIAVDEK